MKSEKQSLTEIYRNWQEEDRSLENDIDQVRDWMGEVNQLGIPHFGETATRLGPLRRRLVEHFEHEDAMIAELAKSYLPTSPEMNGVREQASRDHQQLLARLDDLIQRLSQSEPPFESWQAATDEVELFVEQLEQHEDHETDMIELLMPGRQQDDE